MKAYRDLIEKVLETDPAARYALNVIINCPGVHAMFCYRINNFLWKKLHLKFDILEISFFFIFIILSIFLFLGF